MKTILSTSTLIALSLSRRSYYSSAFSPAVKAAATTTRTITSSSRTLGISSSFHSFMKSTGLFMSASSSAPSQITTIDKSQMTEIIRAMKDDVDTTNKNYVIMDVRNVDEIDSTGKLSPVINTLPLPYIVQQGVFNLDNEDFENKFGFPKPEMDQTLVFHCKAGSRSTQAAQVALQAGYTKILNYTGGANDWFS